MSHHKSDMLGGGRDFILILHRDDEERNCCTSSSALTLALRARSSARFYILLTTSWSPKSSRVAATSPRRDTTLSSATWLHHAGCDWTARPRLCEGVHFVNHAHPRRGNVNADEPAAFSGDSAATAAFQTHIPCRFRHHNREKTTPSSVELGRAEPNPYLRERDPVRTVHWVGRVVEDSVPIQRPQPDIGEEKKGDYSQPDELQQPLLFPPHGYRTRRVGQRRCSVASPEPPALRSGKNFHSDRGTDAGAVTLRCSRDDCR